MSADRPFGFCTAGRVAGSDEARHPVKSMTAAWRAIGYSPVLAIVPVLAAVTCPTSRVHLAPLLVAGAAPIVCVVTAARPERAGTLILAASGTRPAVGSGGLLSVARKLDGPSRLPRDGPLVETVVFGIVAGMATSVCSALPEESTHRNESGVGVADHQYRVAADQIRRFPDDVGQANAGGSVEPRETTGAWPMAASHTSAKVGFVAAAVMVVALAGFVAFGGTDSPTPPTDAPGVEGPRGIPAPDITFQYLDGGGGSLADFRGRPVVLNFFADWCPACVAEMPDFQSVYEDFGGKVVFLGMDQSTSDAGAHALLDQTGVSYQIALDRDRQIFLAFDGFAMPTTIFINEHGEVVDRQNGVIFEQNLRDRLTTLFGNG